MVENVAGNIEHVGNRMKYQNGEQFANLVLFMAYSGARREAALRPSGKMWTGTTDS